MKLVENKKKAIRYQAYAWNGNRYLPISVPVYKTEEEAINAAKEIILDRNNESVLISIRKYWNDKPVCAFPKEVYTNETIL